jgi:phage-related protein
MKDTLFGVLDSIYDGFSESFDDMVAYVFGLITRAKEAGAAFIGGIRDGVNGAIGGLKDSVRNGVAGLVDMLPGSEPKDGSSPLAGLAERGRAIIDNMIPGLQQGLGDMSGVMAGGLGGLADGMQVGNSVNVAINNPMVDSAARINEMRDTIVEAAREAIGSDLARSVDGLILGGGAR